MAEDKVNVNIPELRRPDCGALRGVQDIKDISVPLIED